MRWILVCSFLATFFASVGALQAQDLRFSTVTREPFSLADNGVETGFSIDLMKAIAQDLDKTLVLERGDSFSGMLDAVKDGTVDGAVANISITASRETEMDFTLPIFASGVQILSSGTSGSGSVLAALLTREIGLAILLAFGVLFGCGMLMWVFERARQEYFDHPLKDALFPSFWWALNLVVNGGFEERQPRSRAGRVLGVFMVISSLFIVSIFVARITAAMTVEAIQTNVQSVNDLDGRTVGTIEASTSADFLEKRDIVHATFNDLDSMYTAFEAGQLDAIVFDGPILAYYAATRGRGKARLVAKVFRPENYGIALQTNSPLREEINQSILRLRENGTFDELVVKWFGTAYQ